MITNRHNLLTNILEFCLMYNSLQKLFLDFSIFENLVFSIYLVKNPNSYFEKKNLTLEQYLNLSLYCIIKFYKLQFLIMRFHTRYLRNRYKYYKSTKYTLRKYIFNGFLKLKMCKFLKYSIRNKDSMYVLKKNFCSIRNFYTTQSRSINKYIELFPRYISSFFFTNFKLSTKNYLV